jgi:dipeptidyl-peptidase-4
MRTKSVLWSLIAGLLLLNATLVHALEEKQPLTLESIFASGEFQNKSLQNVQWSNDGSTFSFTEKNPKTGLLDIHEYDIATGDSRLLISGDEIEIDGKPIQMRHYQWAPDHDFLLLTGPQTLTWDSVTEAPFYIYETAGGKAWPLAENNPGLRNVYLSPDGKRVGYVLDNNLYITELKDRSTRAITTDGSADIFNGIFDYASGFFRRDAWHWSPDGKKIAFWRLDATDVNVFYIIDELGRYNKIHTLKYANTGDPHAINQIGIFDVESGRTSWMDIGHEEQDYIPRVAWVNDSQTLAIQRLYQSHQKLELMLGNASTGTTKTIVTDSDPAWIDINDDLFFYRNQDRFVWTSEKSGYRHAYLYDYEGNETQLTSGDWEISSVIDLDETAGWLYFYAKKDSYIDQHVYRVSLDGSKMEKLSKEPGWHVWEFSPDHQHVIQTFSDARTPPSQTLLQPNGDKVRVLEENKIEAMDKYAMSHTEFIKVELEDGILIDGFIIKPTDFDPDKKYPAIGYGYGNAGSQVVVNRWGTQRGPRQDLWHRYMAEQGYIIYAFDNRTTAGRGKAAKNLTYGHYAKYAILDYLEGVEYLKTLPHYDPERFGFWGWSGGGYLAAALMTKGAPNIQTAVSVAPVINLDRYQAVGLQRWMGSLEGRKRKGIPGNQSAQLRGQARG